MTRTKPVDVIVVGAGLSGLRAAVEVHRAGLSVLVFEARDRVGGKTLTLSASAQGGRVDLGAAWINDTNQSEMYKLAREFGFELIKQRDTGFNLARGPDGKLTKFPFNTLPPSSDEGLAAIGAVYKAIIKHTATAHPEKPHLTSDAKDLDTMTFAEFARKASGSETGVAVANMLAAALVGVEAEETSALFMIDYIQSGTGLENLTSDLRNGAQYLRNRQGNQLFSVRLAAELPKHSVHLSTPVSKIHQEKDGKCKVITYAGSVYSARKVIVSLPTCTLPTVEFDPPLPVAKLALTQNTTLGYYAKTIFVFDRPWWREAELSGGLLSQEGPIMFSRDTCVEEDKQYSVTCFIVGDTGRRWWSKWSAAERRRIVTEQFDSFFGEAARAVGVKVPTPINIIEQDWMRDPWSQGAPSPVTTPGTLVDDAGKAIREPWNHVHFVGTETSVVWKGYMEGAVRSGVRGAEEVIAKLSASAEVSSKM